MFNFKCGDFVYSKEHDNSGIIIEDYPIECACRVLFVGETASKQVSYKNIEHCSAKRDKNCEWRYLKSLKSVRTECGGHLGVCEVSAESFEELKIPKWHEFCGYCSGKVVLRKKKMRIGDIEVPTPIRDGKGFVLNLGERSIRSTIYGMQAYSYEQGLVFATKEDAEKMLDALSVLVNNAWLEAEND